MKVFLASDHAGFKLKEFVKKLLEEKGFEVRDFGTNSEQSCDYPDFIIPCSEAVAESNGQALGIVFGGSGIGEEIAANKVKGVRAAQAYDLQSAKDAKIHNNANVITLSGYRFTPEQALGLVEAWLSSEFESEERRTRRVRKITDYENR